MKVKIGDIVFDSKDVAICIELADQEKEHIKNMLPECKKYGSCPDEELDYPDLLAWMNSPASYIGVKNIKCSCGRVFNVKDVCVNDGVSCSACGSSYLLVARIGNLVVYRNAKFESIGDLYVKCSESKN